MMKTLSWNSRCSMAKSVYAIEGIDRLGKTTLIQNIQHKLGFYQTVHFGKPVRLNMYEYSVGDPLQNYQIASFRNSMIMAKSGARLIFDRWHLGECVYAPMYREYDGTYVFDLEKRLMLDETGDIRLVLLTEDFNISQHFVDDHQSIGAVSNRRDEQALFIEAFNRSIIRDKRMVCVTDPALGGFKTPHQILDEVLS